MPRGIELAQYLGRMSGAELKLENTTIVEHEGKLVNEFPQVIVQDCSKTRMALIGVAGNDQVRIGPPTQGFSEVLILHRENEES